MGRSRNPNHNPAPHPGRRPGRPSGRNPLPAKPGKEPGKKGGKPPGKKSDLKARLVTGAALAAVALVLAYLGPATLFALLLVVVLVAEGEFYFAVRKAGHRPATALGLVAGATLLVAAYRRGESAVPVVLFLTMALAFVWHAWGRSRDKALADLGVTILGVAYAPLLASFAAAMLRRHDGRAVVLATIGAAAVYDIFAYAAGRKLGRRPLAPRISPGKTREGAIAASVGVIVAAAAIGPLVGPWNVAEAALLGVLVCGAAPLGDLFESVMKRDLGLKDMGAILPGHGGVLDRIDAILFCVPASYLSLRLFGL